MFKEINQQLPWKYKTLLVYRRLPTIFALLILFMSYIFLIDTFKDFDLREYTYLHSNTSITSGKVTDVYYTGITESSGSDDEYYYYDVMAYEYEYTVGKEYHKWTSYKRKSSLKIGSKVKIIYNKDNPAYSVISNYRYLPNGSPIGYLIIPLIPLLILLFHVYKACRFHIILKKGIITKGRLLKKEDISSENEVLDRYKMTFGYYANPDKKERFTLNVKTSFTEKFEDERKELIVFHKNYPKHAFLVDDLPESVAKFIKKNWVS